jgi:hypothetical protein
MQAPSEFNWNRLYEEYTGRIDIPAKSVVDAIASHPKNPQTRP